MKHYIGVLIAGLLTSLTANGEGCDTKPGDYTKKIFVRVAFKSTVKLDSLVLQSSPFETLTLPRLWQSFKQVPIKGTGRWTIPAQNLTYLYLGGILKKKKYNIIAEPGDSILMDVVADSVIFSGKGVAKLRLQEDLHKIFEKYRVPLDYINKLSIPYFLEQNNRQDKAIQEVSDIFSRYEGEISPYAFHVLKALAISRIEENRLDVFWALRARSAQLNVSPAQLCALFDTCFYKPAAKWLRSLDDGCITGSYAFIRAQVFRKYNFNGEAEDLKSSAKRKFLYYEEGKKTYTGLTLEKYFVDLLAFQTIRENGLVPETEKLLKIYYSEPGYPQYKRFVRDYEAKARSLRNGAQAPAFCLTDADGSEYTDVNLKGKITIVDFWFTGCAGCRQITPILKRIEREFSLIDAVQFLSVSIDEKKEKWLKSVIGKQYTTDNSVNVFTGGKGSDHPMLSAYNVQSYPCIFLIDPLGKIVASPLPDPRNDSGAMLISLIKHELVTMKDGPYIFYDGDSIRLQSIYGDSTNSYYINNIHTDSLESQSHSYDYTFKFPLKEKLYDEPAEFGNVDTVLAFSDIEGNFEALVKLLQGNKVIDQSFNWTFGSGHVVFGGDMFDRGEQVTECLWLLYSLEDKARSAGGYVHFILGNHEIMNLSGDTSYVKSKYLKNARLLGKGYADLYNENTELGRWLRKKNIIEKIGKTLYVHGGISEEVNNLSLSIEEINTLARGYYSRANEAESSPSRDISTLFNTSQKLSPFWHRSYYLEQDTKFVFNNKKRRLDTLYKTSDKTVNNVLSRFDVKTIVTGHTIVADTISVHYSGKIINTDTHHAGGKSEALLFENEKFYRTTGDGKRSFLFKRE